MSHVTYVNESCHFLNMWDTTPIWPTNVKTFVSRWQRVHVFLCPTCESLHSFNVCEKQVNESCPTYKYKKFGHFYNACVWFHVPHTNHVTLFMCILMCNIRICVFSMCNIRIKKWHDPYLYFYVQHTIFFAVKGVTWFGLFGVSGIFVGT